MRLEWPAQAASKQAYKQISLCWSQPTGAISFTRWASTRYARSGRGAGASLAQKRMQARMHKGNTRMAKSFQPSLLYQNGTFVSGKSLSVDDGGRIADLAATAERIDLAGKVLLPGFINAHSHSFQRLIRGRAESRASSGRDFWSWRNMMYQAAAKLLPEDVYDVARMCFLEMARAGITTVGEFHYLHNAPDGRPYDDPNLLAHQVIAAAKSVGLRIVLLRSAYLRSGYELPPDPGQRRFFERADAFLSHTAALLESYASDFPNVSI